MFDKNGIERKMFADFYKMCEEYWIPEDTDNYWQLIIKATDEFVEKYKDVHPAIPEIITGFICGLEKKYKEMKTDVEQDKV